MNVAQMESSLGHSDTRFARRPHDFHDPVAAGVDGSELQFRAISARGKRRGIRLERIFWDALSEAGRAEGRSVGDMVATAYDGMAKGGNLASALRVMGVCWLRDRVKRFERAALPENIFAILEASPSPAFVLSRDKRIVHYNPPFLNFVHASFVGLEHAEVMLSVRLSLDTQLETVLARLREDPRAPVSTGFALGVAGRRIRGQLKATLSPTPDQVMVIAFVVHA